MKNDILTPEEVSKIIMLNQDEVLKGAVKKLFLAPIYGMGIFEIGKDVNQMNWAQYFLQTNPDATNEQIGQDLRGKLEGLKFIATGFAELEKYKAEVEPEKEAENPAI